MNYALEIGTDWLRLHFDDAPTRLHERGVEPDSALGAPAMAPRMMAWLSQHPCTTVSIETTVECHHPRPGNPCPDCANDGVKAITSERYKWPLRAALFSVDQRVHVPPRTPKYGNALYRYRLNDWNADATIADLGMSQEQGERFLVEAIRLVRSRYAEGPVRRSRMISESQAMAEVAA